MAGTYRIAEDVIEATLDASLEGGLLEERVTRPRQRRILRLIEEARGKGRLRALRKRLFVDCEADMQLLHDVERDFQDLFTADPKLSLVQRLVCERVGEHRKVLLVSQFADTAFAVYRALCADAMVVGSGIGLVMSTAKGGEAPVQVNRRASSRDEVLRRFAPKAWAQNAIESGVASGRNGTSAPDEISVLVGTDTISVGQNLQDARTILHLDLTWNPMVLEQRIGRLDRPRHESDNEPIEVRYFLNLDLIEAELQLKKKIEARLEATYRDTAFDDEILPGYFELIEKMHQLRAERADATEIAREVDALVEELAATRPAEVGSNGAEARRVALERLPEKQYVAFLTRWELTDEGLSRWLDALTTGIDLDDVDLVERVRQLETAPSTILDAFGVVRDAVPSDEETGTPSVQLELALEPVVHRIEARVRSLRINLHSVQWPLARAKSGLPLYPEHSCHFTSQ